MSVYVIQPEGESFVKIGSTGNVPGRLSALQTAHARQLSVVALLPGGTAEEIALHTRFESQRVRGEWFRLDEAVADFLAAFSKPVSKWQAAVAAANELVEAIAADLGKLELSVADVAKKHGIATSTIYFLFPGGRHKIQQKRKR